MVHTPKPKMFFEKCFRVERKTVVRGYRFFRFPPIVGALACNDMASKVQIDAIKNAIVYAYDINEVAARRFTTDLGIDTATATNEAQGSREADHY